GSELRLEVDPQAAAAEVREKVAAIRERLPKEVEDPTIQRFDVAALPVMTYAVGSTQPSDVTRRQVEDKLKPLIEQIDVATVVDGYAERTSTTRLDGVDAVSFAIRKQSGANTVEITRRVRETLARVMPTFPQLSLKETYADANFIKENVAEVRKHILFGG